MQQRDNDPEASPEGDDEPERDWEPVEEPIPQAEPGWNGTFEPGFGDIKHQGHMTEVKLPAIQFELRRNGFAKFFFYLRLNL